MAIAIVAISIFQSIKPFLSYSIRATFRTTSSSQASAIGNSDNTPANSFRGTQPKRRFLIDSTYNSSKKSFVNGLLLALELESASAILKMGIFATSSVGLDPLLSQTQNSPSVLDGNFLFFVSVLTLRIAINQTLHRFS